REAPHFKAERDRATRNLLPRPARNERREGKGRGVFNRIRLLSPSGGYLFSGSGCRAATTPPRAAAERIARTGQLAVSPCTAGRGATCRSATSSTSPNRYSGGEEGVDILRIRGGRSKIRPHPCTWCFAFEIWNFSGAWSLEFGSL